MSIAPPATVPTYREIAEIEDFNNINNLFDQIDSSLEDISETLETEEKAAIAELRVRVAGIFEEKIKPLIELVNQIKVQIATGALDGDAKLSERHMEILSGAGAALQSEEFMMAMMLVQMSAMMGRVAA